MRFYTRQHRHYCGINLHARSMYLCIVDQAGEVLLHRNMRTTPAAFLKAVAPYREDLVVAVECIFTWYWLADLCEAEGIEFVLGHALYMKAIHGGKAKNDRIDSAKIATLLRGGIIPSSGRSRRRPSVSCGSVRGRKPTTSAWSGNTARGRPFPTKNDRLRGKCSAPHPSLNLTDPSLRRRS